MADKVVDIKGKRGAKPPKLPPVDLEKVKNLSMTRMTTRHMCLLLDVTEEEFNLLRIHSPEFSKALETGRAEAIHACALTVLKAAQGQLGTQVVTTGPNGEQIVTREFGDREREQLKAAQLYLRTHAPNWMSNKE